MDEILEHVAMLCKTTWSRSVWEMSLPRLPPGARLDQVDNYFGKLVLRKWLQGPFRKTFSGELLLPRMLPSSRELPLEEEL